ncbi:MAG: Na/Pi cotransporter family protein, partial [Firmicutes bacterium]|nr:Na/Pi cotransporter family protein [Bacillota bacterium]
MFNYLVRLCTGFTLLISGMKQINNAFKYAIEKDLKNYAKSDLNYIFVEMSIGIFLTMIVQSSSIITLIVIALVNSNVITFRQSAGIIMGSNIGTTITTHILSFKMYNVILYILAIGLVLYLIDYKPLKNISKFLIGFSFIFYGLYFLESSVSLNYNEKLIIFIKKVSHNPVLSISAGILLTAIFQSSSLTSVFLVLIARLAHIDLKPAALIIIGANIGTCATSIIASFWANRNAKKAALFHLFYNIIGAIFVICIFPLYIHIVNYVSPH